MSKTAKEELEERGFHSIFDVLDLLDSRMKEADETCYQHYMFVKSEIESHMCNILRNRTEDE